MVLFIVGTEPSRGSKRFKAARRVCARLVEVAVAIERFFLEGKMKRGVLCFELLGAENPVICVVSVSV